MATLNSRKSFLVDSSPSHALPRTLSLLAVAILLASSLSSVSSLILAANTEVNLIRNGDFSQQLESWTAVKVSSGIYGLVFPIIGVHNLSSTNPVGYIDAPGGADGYFEQNVTLPNVDQITLTFLVWGRKDPVNASVSIIDSTGYDDILETYDPSCKMNDGCTVGEVKSYNITRYAGQQVRVRFRNTSENGDGTIVDFDNIAILVILPTTTTEPATSTSTSTTSTTSTTTTTTTTSTTMATTSTTTPTSIPSSYLIAGIMVLALMILAAGALFFWRRRGTAVVQMSPPSKSP